MNRLSPELHGILDYITVALLFLTPSVFQFGISACIFTYLLATVHFLVTLSTDFPGGVFKIITLRVHGLIELVVSVTLVSVGILFRTFGDTIASYYYLSFSVILFVVWLVSDYDTVTRKHS
jgi:hypothetical protein